MNPNHLILPNLISLFWRCDDLWLYRRDDGHQRVLWRGVWSHVLLSGQPHRRPQGESDGPGGAFLFPWGKYSGWISGPHRLVCVYHVPDQDAGSGQLAPRQHDVQLHQHLPDWRDQGAVESKSCCLLKRSCLQRPHGGAVSPHLTRFSLYYSIFNTVDSNSLL